MSDTTRTRAEALVRKLTLMSNLQLRIDEVTQALDAERQAAMEEAAVIAENFQWTLSAGTENIPMVDIAALAQAIRQQSCGSVTQAQASREKDNAVS